MGKLNKVFAGCAKESFVVFLAESPQGKTALAYQIDALEDFLVQTAAGVASRRGLGHALGLSGELIMSVTPEQLAWLNFVKISSLPLRRIASSGLPDSVASGCIVNYHGRKFVLSVAHATGNGENWAAEVRHEKGRGTLLHRFGATYFLAEHNIATSTHEEVDFSYSEVQPDFESWFQVLDMSGAALSEERREEFEFARHEPSTDETYAFAGQVRTEIHSSQLLVSEMVVYPGLRYERTDGGYHVFRLPVPHPGHDAFQGCSGAPILDSQRRIVGLVCSGDIGENTITAVSLARCGAALDAHILSGATA